MKKILSLLLVLSMCFALAACGNNENSENAGQAGTVQQTASEEGNVLETENAETQDRTSNETQSTDESSGTEQKEDSDMDSTTILVEYFSRTGENYSVGYIEKGNTHIIADMIAEQTGGELFEIRTVNPYPDKYDECTDVAKREQQENARPELAETVESMEQYDIIFLGYPNWWGDMPMAVYTFLESYDFSGKTIVPFCTHEGSGLSSTESSIAEVCADTEVLDGLAIRGSVAQNSQDKANESVISWLKKAGFID